LTTFAATMRLKRIIDVSASLVLLTALSPILLAAAIAVRSTSSGPIFYSGKRWGFNESTFACHKFRSMVTDQQTALRQRGLAEFGDDGRPLLHDADPRLTSIGALLRKSSIDELPQLINVLRGEMSLIGPRPLAIGMLDQLADFRAARSVVRPGITGLWQVRGRTKNASALDMVADDLEYIRRFSLALDVDILWRTVPRILGP
jgi:exopolysaccharide production protein ExoY